MLGYIYLSTLLCSVLLGAAYWKHLTSRFLHILVPPLAIIFIIEIYSFYVMKVWNAPTGWVYNISCLFESTTYAVFYYCIPFNKRYRPVIAAMTSALLLTAIVSYSAFVSISFFNTYIFLGSTLLIVLCGIFFLYEYFQLDNTEQEKKWVPVVWITGGLLIFFSIASITLALYHSLVSYKVTVFGIKLHQLIPQVLSIIRYGCVIIAFYLCKKKN